MGDCMGVFDDDDDGDNEMLQTEVFFNRREKKHHLFSSQSSFKIPFLSFVFLIQYFKLWSINSTGLQQPAWNI